MMDCLGDVGVILFTLKPQFRGQKKWFKKILGPASGVFFCYYGWLPRSDPKRKRTVIMAGYRGPTPNAARTTRGGNFP